jgi:hypothetical protein
MASPRDWKNCLAVVEISAFTGSDQSLSDKGLTEDVFEVFRRLIPSCSGTLDELLEVAVILWGFSRD